MKVRALFEVIRDGRERYVATDGISCVDCDICGQLNASSSNATHMIWHTLCPDGEYRCPYCVEKYARENNPLEHVAVLVKDMLANSNNLEAWEREYLECIETQVAFQLEIDQ